MPNGNPAPGPLNSRYFRPVRGKETRARRWDLQFESTSLQRGVSCEPGFGLAALVAAEFSSTGASSGNRNHCHSKSVHGGCELTYSRRGQERLARHPPPSEEMAAIERI